MKNYPPYFTKRELKCKCGRCRGSMDDAFMAKLSAMRREAGFGFILSSAYRCPNHNVKVSSTGREGPHTTGRAVDIVCFGAKAHRVVELANKHGMTGVGISQKGRHSKRFVHVDDLSITARPWIWSY